MNPQTITPIFRIFDESKAREFYLDFLGFQLDWEHRYEPGTPLYMQVSKGDVKLHLSEHHGDCTPGSSVRIELQGVSEFQKELLNKKYKYLRPGIQKTPWKTAECCVLDPFGNKIIYYENQ